MTDTTLTEAEAIAQLVRDADTTLIHDITDDDDDALEYRVYGRGHDGELQLVEAVDLEKRRDHPRSKRGTIAVHTPQALVAYANRHLDADVSTLWGDVEQAKLTVVLNDHGDGDDLKPGWGDHRAVLALQKSPEWKAWTALAADEFVQQTVLAEFLEENINAIVEPSGAAMLEVAQTFHATVGARFKQSKSLHSGEQQLVYEEDINAKAGASGQAEIPKEFLLALRPFIGTEPVAVQARFRFRLRDGHLYLGVKLLNIEDVLREAVDQVLTDVAEQLALVAIEGVAPTPLRT